MFLTLIWKQGNKKNVSPSYTQGATFKQSTESNLPLPSEFWIAIIFRIRAFSELEQIFECMDFQGAYVKKQSVQELEHIFNIFPSAELEQISRCIDFQGVYAQKQSVQELEHISNVLSNP